MVLFWLLLFKRGGGTTDQLQKSSFSAIDHLSLQEWKTFFPLAFQCIIVIHLTIASVVSLVALYRITIMSRCSSLVFKRAVAPEICDYGLTNLEG